MKSWRKSGHLLGNYYWELEGKWFTSKEFLYLFTLSIDFKHRGDHPGLGTYLGLGRLFVEFNVTSSEHDVGIEPEDDCYICEDIEEKNNG